MCMSFRSSYISDILWDFQEGPGFVKKLTETNYNAIVSTDLFRFYLEINLLYFSPKLVTITCV